MKRMLTATTPVGVFTRTTARNYKWVVVVSPDQDHVAHGAWGWTESEHGLERMLRDAERAYGTGIVRVFPVDGS